MSIYVDMIGRCGNQMFQYAFAKKISMLNNDMPICIDFWNVDRWKKQTGLDSFDDQLQYFNVKPYLARTSCDNNMAERGSKVQLFIRWIFCHVKNRCRPIASVFHDLSQKFGIYREEEWISTPRKCLTKDVFVRGYFENPVYFEDIREELIKEYTPKYPEKDKNARLYEIIRNSESICVSFRKWGETSETIKKERDVCGEEYYVKAIERMHELVPDAIFIVFSDDIQWVKENFKFPFKTYFEDGTDEIWEKLRLMYSCKHFIMTTSTFTWWAQYLCRNKGKIVISPERWYNSDMESKLLMDDWIRISC